MENNQGNAIHSVAKFAQNNPALVTGLVVLGGLTTARYTFTIGRKLWGMLLRPSQDLYKRYQGGYAVITGATDGLGLEYAKQLAQKGFNLVLIARNQEKLNNVKQSLESVNPQVDIKTSVFDFDVPYSDEIYSPLKQSLSQISDVSILINNVGAIAGGSFNEMPLSEMNKMIQINCIPQMVMIKYLLPSLMKRSQVEGKRCAIISLSSSAMFVKAPRFAMYAATKSYNKVLSDVLNKEVGEYIDVLAVHPGPTRSNMIKFDAPFVIQPHQHVERALSNLGKETETFGHYQHWLYCNAFRLPYFGTWYGKIRAKRQQEAENKLN